MTHAERYRREGEAVLAYVVRNGKVTARDVAYLRIPSVPDYAFGIGYDRARLILNRLVRQGRLVRAQEKRQRGIRPEWVYSRPSELMEN